MISRAIIHIDGPPGAGKTAFVERLLGVLDEWVLAVRCRRDQSLRQARESPSARDPEVRRYRAAGASDAGRFTFPSGRDVADAFFTSRLLTDISDVVVIEGDSPLRDADLRVFVASPPAVGQTLLVQPKNWATSVAVAHLVVSRANGAWKVVERRSDLIQAAGHPENAAVLAATDAAHRETVAYVTTPIGTTADRWSADSARVKDTPLIDLILEPERRATGADLASTAAFSIARRACRCWAA